MELIAIFQNPTFVGYKELKNSITKNKVRHAMNNVFIDLQNNKLVATNGHILITYPLTMISKDANLDIKGLVVNPLLFDVNKWTVVEHLKENVKNGFYNFEIRDDGYVYVMCDEEELYRAQYYTDLTYPSWEAVVPTGAREGIYDISFSSTVLGSLANSIPKTVLGKVDLKFFSSNKGVAFNVDVDEDSSIFGIIIPMFVHE